MGAAYVVTGSINQACVESGLSDSGRAMLAQAGQADVIMAPAADMFEMGVKVQVLKRGTMFAMRGARLYELYSTYPSLEAIPAAERERLEKGDLPQAARRRSGRRRKRSSASAIPQQLERAGQDPKHQMALVFRWYLGLSSRWAIAGEPRAAWTIRSGAARRWARSTTGSQGSFLEPVGQPHASCSRAQPARGRGGRSLAPSRLRTSGVAVPPDAFSFAPRPLA